MNKINWTTVAIVSMIAVLVLLFGASLLGNRGYGGWGMMGHWGFVPFGWVGMFFMWLIPLGLIVLTVLGIAWLVKEIGRGNSPAAPAHSCPSCGRQVEADWNICPYCGTSLTK